MKREVFVVWFTPDKTSTDRTGWPFMDGKGLAHETAAQAKSAMEKEPLNKTGELSVKRFVEARLRRKP